MSGGNIFFRRNLLSDSGRCLRDLLRSPLDPSTNTSASILRKQYSRPYVRSSLFLSRKYRQSDISSSTLSFISSPSSSSPSKTGLVTWYLGMIEARPVLTKSITAGLIYTASDVSSQMITLTPSDFFDPIRMLRMAGYGLLFIGPSLHVWFNFISKFLPKRDILSIFKKLLMGQTIYGPIMNSIFFSLNAGLQGENGAEIVARLKRDMVPTTINGLMYWPMCDFITFKFIPVRLQPLISNSFSFIWTIYITYMASLKKASSDKITTY